MDFKNQIDKIFYEKQQILNDIKTILLDMPNQKAVISKYNIRVRNGKIKLHSVSLLGISKYLAVTTSDFYTYHFEHLITQTKDLRDILEIVEDVQKMCCKTYKKYLRE